MREVSISAFFGIVTGPLFLLTAIALDVLGLRFDVWLPIVISLTIASTALIYALRNANRKMLGVAVALFIISSTYSVSFFYDFSLIGPTPEQQAYMHLLSKIRDESGKVDSNWRDSSWDFLSPRCYSALVVRKYDDSSLEIAVFSYRYSKTQYDPNRFIRILFTKLSCGYADSEAAYEEYKRTLSNAGFELKENNSSFLAENESLVVFCNREGELITVALVGNSDVTLKAKVVNRKG